jgi:hypothetical protein
MTPPSNAKQAATLLSRTSVISDHVRAISTGFLAPQVGDDGAALLTTAATEAAAVAVRQRFAVALKLDTAKVGEKAKEAASKAASKVRQAFDAAALQHRAAVAVAREKYRETQAALAAATTPEEEANAREKMFHADVALSAAQVDADLHARGAVDLPAAMSQASVEAADRAWQSAANSLATEQATVSTLAALAGGLALAKASAKAERAKGTFDGREAARRFDQIASMLATLDGRAAAQAARVEQAQKDQEEAKRLAAKRATKRAKR